MPARGELTYTTRELRSFLPTGWRIEPNADGGWVAAEGAWISTLRDATGLDWELRVALDEARDLGREKALRMAMTAIRRRGR